MTDGDCQNRCRRPPAGVLRDVYRQQRGQESEILLAGMIFLIDIEPTATIPDRHEGMLRLGCGEVDMQVFPDPAWRRVIDCNSAGLVLLGNLHGS